MTLLGFCMLDIRYWKLFRTHYGIDTYIGRLLYKAQDEVFANEHKGILVNQMIVRRLWNKIGCGPDPIICPQLGPNKSAKDLDKARFIWSRTSTTVHDIQRFRICHSEHEFVDRDLKTLARMTTLKSPKS